MKKILIIDDEPDVAESIRLVLEAAGYPADKISNARAALDIAKDYDLLLLDLLMPKFSGRQFLSAMRERKIEVPIIVLSAAMLANEISAELVRDYGEGVVLVQKTSVHSDLMPEIEKKLGKP